MSLLYYIEYLCTTQGCECVLNDASARSPDLDTNNVCQPLFVRLKCEGDFENVICVLFNRIQL